VEGKATGVPGKAEELEQRAQRAFGVDDEGVVVEVEQIVRVDLLPVRHQPPVLAVLVPDVAQAAGVVEDARVEVLHEDRKRIVDGVSNRVHDPCHRKQAFDQADQQVVVGALVGDVPGMSAARREARQEVPVIVTGKCLAADVVQRRQGCREGRQYARRHARQQVELAGDGHVRMSTQDLFEQGGTGAEHAADEDRLRCGRLRSRRAPWRRGR